MAIADIAPNRFMHVRTAGDAAPAMPFSAFAVASTAIIILLDGQHFSKVG